MLITSLFVGFMLGAFISGKVSGHFGRKSILISTTFSAFVTSLLSAFSPNIYYFCFLRACYGLCVGLVSPVAASIGTEITPEHYRSILFSFKGIPFVIG